MLSGVYGEMKEASLLSCIFIHKSLLHKYHLMHRSSAGLCSQRLHHTEIKARQVKISLVSALTLVFLSHHFFISFPLTFTYTCIHVCRQEHTHTHSGTRQNLHWLPPANWHQLFSCMLTHAYTLLSQSFVCKVAGWDGLLWLLLPGYVTRSSKLLYFLKVSLWEHIELKR